MNAREEKLSCKKFDEFIKLIKEIDRLYRTYTKIKTYLWMSYHAACFLSIDKEKILNKYKFNDEVAKGILTGKLKEIESNEFVYNYKILYMKINLKINKINFDRLEICSNLDSLQRAYLHYLGAKEI